MTLDEKLDKLLDVVGRIEWRLDRLDDVLLPRIENRLGGTHPLSGEQKRNPHAAGPFCRFTGGGGAPDPGGLRHRGGREPEIRRANHDSVVFALQP